VLQKTVIRVADRCPPPSPKSSRPPHPRSKHWTGASNTCPASISVLQKTGQARPVGQHPLNTGQMRRLVLQFPQHPSTDTTGAHQNTNLPIQTKHFKTGALAKWCQLMPSHQPQPEFSRTWLIHPKGVCENRHQFTTQLVQSKTSVF
jgi:hypothetical protein